MCEENHFKLLLIEDNPGDARLILEMLDETGGNEFELEIRDKLAGGLEYIKEEKLDIIVMDLGLPDSQGFETFKSVRNAAPDSPIVVLTGHDDKTFGINAVQDGAQDYLVKGQITGCLLTRSLQYAIERQKLIRKLQEANSKINTLQGLLPICAACKKIRDKSGSWTSVETFVRDRSDAEFTHSMCPECAKEYYPQLYKEGKLFKDNKV